MDVFVGSSLPRARSSWEAAGTFRPLWVHHSLDTEGGGKKVVLQLGFFCYFSVFSG